jgi:hypothetical protein
MHFRGESLSSKFGMAVCAWPVRRKLAELCTMSTPFRFCANLRSLAVSFLGASHLIRIFLYSLHFERLLGLLQGKLLAGIDSRVQLYRWNEREDGSNELTSECSYSGHVLALYVVTQGDFIIVGEGRAPAALWLS